MSKNNGVFMMNGRGKVVGPHRKKRVEKRDKKDEVVEHVGGCNECNCVEEDFSAAPEKKSEVTDNNKAVLGLGSIPSFDKVFSLGDKGRVLMTAMDVFGLDAQLDMMVEESAELINAIAKMRRGRAAPSDVMEEMVDVFIMLYQLMYVYTDLLGEAYTVETVQSTMEAKIQRVQERITNHLKKAAG